MPYNNDIRHYAPLPSGALPTSDEMDALASRKRRQRISAVRNRLGRMILGR